MWSKTKGFNILIDFSKVPYANLSSTLFLPHAACLRATDFPTVWIFREPFIPARPWPPQQDLEHLTSPHDCHHLRVAFTAGDCPINGLADAPQENGGLGDFFFLFFLDTVGMCRMYPVNLFAFSPPPLHFFFCHSGFFVLLKRTQGWTKPETVLFDHFFLLYFYLLEFNS